MKNYQEILRETVENLIDARKQLFEKLVNISMSNELSEVNDVFEEGDIYQFELSHFENSSDANINLLVELIKKVEQTTYYICNLNGINIEEE